MQLSLPLRLAAASAAAASVCAAFGDYTHAVASDAVSDDSGASPSWLYGLPTWHVGTDVIPASPALPAGAPARDMVFGAPLSWAVGPGLNATSDFQLELTLLDDGTGAARVQALSAGGAVVAPRIALPDKAVLVARFNVSGGALAAGGVLALSLASLAGPNAVLSAFTLFSSWPGDPPLTPTEPPAPTHALPRLTPRPASVAAAGAVVVAAADLYLDLHGVWDFSATGVAANWTPIVVPGEYTLQGYRVAAGQPVLYQRAFELPDAWAALRVKLRCDGVYSNASVTVNGVAVGAHLGGMTPFELDVTDALQPGSNTLALLVVSASLADTLASASTYATHDLGGISRKIGLVAVPTVSVADVHVVTAFADGDWTAATLVLNISIANDGAVPTSAPVNVAAALAYGGSAEASGNVAAATGLAGGGAIAFAALNLSVTAPPLWDPEHPRLHDLTLTLTLAGSATEVVALRVGFRDVRVVGVNRVAINGRVIKARGTTRHEAHPLVGRSLWTLPPAGKQWERDIAAFLDANINYVRTSHYPPPEELMAAADELGMLIELEMPFCWASGNSGEAAFNYTVQAQREAIVANRNHPSVIHWSLGNESPWTANFARSLQQFLRELDGTRPFMFDGGEQQPIPPLDILSVHYPSFDGPATYANGSQPTLFGEYAHLNCYNRRELVTDPGVRDIWGLGIEKMWELIYAADGVLGACYWAGIDDIFYMPSGEPVGYGEWGVIDAWRRPKPETFLVRNIYSPVRLTPPPPGSAWAPVLTVDNRHDFTDLAELAFAWRILESGASGDGSAAGGPHTAGCALTLHGLPADLVGTLEVNATSPRGFLINTWQFPLAAAASVAAPHAAGGGAPPAASLLADGRLQIQDAAGAFTWFVSPAGALSGNTSAGALLAGGPTLMVLDVSGEDAMQLTEGMPPILPFNDPLAGWAMTNRSWATVGNALQVVLTGTYTQAAGTFTLAFTSDARCACAFSFSWAGAPISPRQVGLVFDAPADLASLSWRRTTPWSAYPSDHIGRPAGDAVTPNAGPAPGAQPRNVSWARDAAPLGCADFRATKHNISAFQLASDDGLRAIALLSDGHSQHGRAWVGSAATQFLAATVSTEGGNPFSREKVLPQPTYTKGDDIAGVIVLQLGAAIKIEE